MARRSLPTRDSALLGWSLNFTTLINAAPATYGLTPALAAGYSALHDAYARALAAADPAIRSKFSTATKNEARTRLRANARLLLNLIAGTAAVTDAQKIALGFALRGTASPAPRPAEPPSMAVASVSGFTVKIDLYDHATLIRHKPAGVSGASLFSYVGEAPPSDLTQWKFEGLTGRSTMNITFPSTIAPGTKIWFSARWFNNRKQSGPASSPICTNLHGGTVQSPNIAAAA
jgi:hypothetical protein